MRLNPGIVRLVQALNEAGFRTTDSGDGETHDAECDRPHGYVVAIVSDSSQLASEADRLAALMRSLGIAPVPMTEEEPPDGSCWIQATYSPADGYALLDVSHVHDRMIQA